MGRKSCLIVALLCVECLLAPDQATAQFSFPGVVVVLGKLGSKIPEIGLNVVLETLLGKVVDHFISAHEEPVSAEGMYVLGVAYATGRGVSQNYSEAAKWYLKSAEKGNARAQAGLAGFYLEGTGVARDLMQAEKWCRASDQQGGSE